MIRFKGGDILKKFLLYAFFCVISSNIMLIGGVFNTNFGGYMFFIGAILTIITFVLAVDRWRNWKE